MLRILYDDFDEKVKNIHDEMDLQHSYKKKSVYFTKSSIKSKISVSQIFFLYSLYSILF